MEEGYVFIESGSDDIVENPLSKQNEQLSVIPQIEEDPTVENIVEEAIKPNIGISDVLIRNYIKYQFKIREENEIDRILEKYVLPFDTYLSKYI